MSDQIMKITEPGIYKLSMEDYHSNIYPAPCLSRSVIKDLLFKSPAHAFYNHPALNPNFQEIEDSKFDLGTAAHALLLEGESNTVVIDAEDWRTKAARQAREEARKEGKTPLLAHQFERVNAVVVAVQKQIESCKELRIFDLRANGESELSYIWQEEETWLKVRPDWISRDRKLMLDFKFTEQSANPETLDRHIASMGYCIQNALYVRGVRAIDVVESKFVFVFVELSEPHFCSFVSLSPGFLELGKQQCDYGKFLWESCLQNNEWPAYPVRICHVDAPVWAISHWEEVASHIGIGK